MLLYFVPWTPLEDFRPLDPFTSCPPLTWNPEYTPDKHTHTYHIIQQNSSKQLQ